MDHRSEVVDAPVEHSTQHRPRGFLPIDTNAFDRLFVGVVGHVALNLLWMRLLEAYLPLWIATLLGIVWIVVVIRWG